MLFSEPVFVESVGSTNNYLKRLARQGCKEGFVIFAGEQTLGRGTKKRKWFSPKGGLWFSFLLRNEKRPELLPVVASLSVACALKKFLQADRGMIGLKWMNDVCFGGKKVAGVLCESFFSGNESRSVVGVGINTNVAGFPKNLAKDSTSLLIQTGKAVDNRALLGLFLEEFSKNLKKGKSRLWKEYGPRNLALGSTAVFADGRKGTVMAIDKDFNLVVECREERIKADFHHIKKLK